MHAPTVWGQKPRVNAGLPGLDRLGSLPPAHSEPKPMAPVTGPLLSTLFLSTLLAPPLPQDAAAGEDWPSFRGPHASGVVEGQALPVEWDVAAGENVLWRTPVAGLAHSSPVVQGDRVYVTTAERVGGEAELSSLYGSEGYGAGDSVPDEGPQRFRLLALDADSGEVLWERTAYEGVPEVKRHPKSTHANPTPACDATRVVAFFGSEGLFCYDREGTLQWSVDFGVLDAGAPDLGDSDRDSSQYQWGFASSPVLHEGRVLVQCDVQGQSFLAALDAATGEELWRTLREENPTWSTPTVYVPEEGPAQVIANGYRHIGAYDLETGAELWRAAGGGDVPVPTPVVAHDLIYFTSAHGRLAPLYAVHAGATGTLEPADSEHVAWYHPRRGVYMQTPLVYGYELYTNSDGGILACYDALSGESVFRERLGEGRTGFSGSPVAGDGKLYLTAESGEVHVVQAGRSFETLAVNDLGEPCLATPAIAGGRLYFRTRHHLVAIGE